jgi:hypothetical protein
MMIFLLAIIVIYFSWEIFLSGGEEGVERYQKLRSTFV